MKTWISTKTWKQSVNSGLSAILLGLLLLLAPLAAKAQESRKIVLLVGIDFDQLRRERPIASLGVEDAIDRRFKATFKALPYQLQTIKKARIEDLWRVARAPDTEALFWVSHGGSDQSLAPGAGSQAALVDVNQQNILPALADINPGIRWISLIACDSFTGWREIVVRHHPALETTHPGLKVQTFTGKIRLLPSVREAFKTSLPHLANASNPISPIPPKPIQQGGFLFVLERRAPSLEGQAVAPALVIELDGKILGLMPTARSGEVQSATFLAPTALPPPGKLKLRVDSGISADSILTEEPPVLGDITPIGLVSRWKVFAGRDGTPFGVTFRIFQGSNP